MQGRNPPDSREPSSPASEISAGNVIDLTSRFPRPAEPQHEPESPSSPSSLPIWTLMLVGGISLLLGILMGLPLGEQIASRSLRQPALELHKSLAFSPSTVVYWNTQGGRSLRTIPMLAARDASSGEPPAALDPSRLRQAELWLLEHQNDVWSRKTLATYYLREHDNRRMRDEAVRWLRELANTSGTASDLDVRNNLAVALALSDETDLALRELEALIGPDIAQQSNAIILYNAVQIIQTKGNVALEREFRYLLRYQQIAGLDAPEWRQMMKDRFTEVSLQLGQLPSGKFSHSQVSSPSPISAAGKELPGKETSLASPTKEPSR